MFASMRPGRLTPENSLILIIVIRKRIGFNEAGAINPGKPARDVTTSRLPIGFNEAGAINPGKLDGPGLLPVAAFASMRPGRLTPENLPVL